MHVPPFCTASRHLGLCADWPSCSAGLICLHAEGVKCSTIVVRSFLVCLHPPRVLSQGPWVKDVDVTRSCRLSTVIVASPSSVGAGSRGLVVVRTGRSQRMWREMSALLSDPTVRLGLSLDMRTQGSLERIAPSWRAPVISITPRQAPITPDRHPSSSDGHPSPPGRHLSPPGRHPSLPSPPGGHPSSPDGTHHPLAAPVTSRQVPIIP